jgi:hypothetical protein
LQSFNEPGQESFIKMLTTLIKFAPKGYKPPSPFLIRTKYLDKKFAKTQAEMTLLFQDLEHHCALALQSDGKTKSGKRPIVNYIAQSPKGGHFLGCDDMSDCEKNCKKMADYICEEIRNTGKERSFALVVLDGALRASFPYIEAQMPWLTTMWCSCHISSHCFSRIASQVPTQCLH